ncbi:hypothetical protein BKM35_22155 [Salmonella enterica]|nr:hypothetical protein [Salmonella enterica]
MSSASNYTELNIINAMLRGIAYPMPTNTWVSLHTADPGEDGANEVSTTDWPSYKRICAELTGAIGTGWIEPVDGVTKNSNQLIFPTHNGAVATTVTHFAVYDAETGGNMLVYAPLTATRSVAPDDVFLFDTNAINIAAA